MTSKKIDRRIVGIALIPALGLSIRVVFVGGIFGLSESVADRVSQIAFLPACLSACHYTKRRRSATPA